jgi:hypothetical protein
VEAGPAPYYWGEYGWVIDGLAADLNALVVLGEHRGFGLTYPQPSHAGGSLDGWKPDAAHAGVLTEEQVLADYTALATSLRTNLSAWDSPLIAIGGSLSGEMSAWWRIRYPFMVDMALSASAPIFGFTGSGPLRLRLAALLADEQLVPHPTDRDRDIIPPTAGSCPAGRGRPSFSKKYIERKGEAKSFPTTFFKQRGREGETRSPPATTS